MKFLLIAVAVYINGEAAIPYPIVPFETEGKCKVALATMKTDAQRQSGEIGFRDRYGVRVIGSCIQQSEQGKLPSTNPFIK